MESAKDPICTDDAAKLPHDEHTHEQQSAPLSKRQLKRKLRLEKRKETQQANKKSKRQEERKKRKENKNKEREDLIARVDQCTDEIEKQRMIDEYKRKHGKGRRETKEKQRIVREKMLSASIGFCLDMQWWNDMTERQQRSMLQQISYCYHTVAEKAADPSGKALFFTLANVPENMISEMDRYITGWRSWPLLEICNQEPHKMRMMQPQEDPTTQPTRQVVYLSADAEEELDHLRPDELYIVGGMVDRNHRKGATLEKAAQNQWKSYKLKIDPLLGSGCRVLTCTAVVNILTLAVNGSSWFEACQKSLPARKFKGLKQVGTDQQGASSNESDDDLGFNPNAAAEARSIDDEEDHPSSDSNVDDNISEPNDNLLHETS